MSNKHFSLLIDTLELAEELTDSNFENFSLDNIEKDNNNKVWTFNFSGNTLPDVAHWTLFIQKLRDSFLGDYLVNYRLSINERVTDKKVIEYWKYVILENFGEVSGVLIESILFSEVKVQDKNLLIKIMAPSIWKNFVSERKNAILDSYKKLGIIINDIVPEFAKTNVRDIAEQQEEKISKEMEKLEQIEQKETEKKTKDQPKKNRSFNAGTKYGKEIRDAEIVDIKDVIGYSGDVTIMAQVFGTEQIVHRNGSSQYRLKLTDYSDSIILRLFGNNPNFKFQNNRRNQLIELIQGIKKGQWIKIFGTVSNDPYLRDTIIEPKAIEVAVKEEKKDNYNGRKRIELNTHTKMSQLEGISSAEDYLMRATSWGHEAIAFTDTYGVQAYPEICLKSKEKDIKTIYGLNAFIMDDSLTATINPKELRLKDATYVVFDVETTGLSAERDRLIEIAAVKVKNGAQIDTFESYINPKRPISELITRLTSITDEDVKDAPFEKEVMTNFYNWLDKDDILVAHNAKFDLGFLDKSFERLGLKNNNHASIDTLFISRAENKEAKRHGLSNLAKLYKVKLVQHHRAIYDTRVTADIFIKMLDQLYALGIEYHNQIDNMIDLKLAHKRSRSFPCSILVKNAQGLKDLFRLVSYSCTDYLSSGKPTIPRSLLSKYRKHLLIGNGNSDNEVFEELLNAKEDKVEQIIDFYDYIEVQPKHHYESFIRSERIDDEAELEEILKHLISLAKKKEKLVVATGDCYYLDDYQHVYRQILRLTVKNNPGARDIKPLATFLTTEEMLKEFSFLDEKLRQEIVIDNTHVISDMIEKVVPLKDKLYTPNIEGAADEVRNLSYSMAHKIYGENLPEIVEKRLEKELASIIGNGFSVVYLISHKLVKKSLDDGYLVGSRGSVGSSLVATMMEITEVNPLSPHYVCPKCKHSEFFVNAEYASGFDMPNKNCPHCNEKMKKDGQDIPFETFLGFNGDKVPDIDLNFSGEYQATAHNFTKEIFGEDYVYRAGTISTVAEKTAYSFTRDYYEKHEIDKRSIDIERIAAGCEGVKRTTGQHPGGILVVPNDMDIFDFTPYQYPADDETSTWRTTHFDFHSIHDNILKFDILGHDDPTMIRKLQDLSGIDPKTIDVSDSDVMGIFSTVEALGVTREQVDSASGTFGIPEFGTNFVIQMLDDTKPTTYSELVQISGLSHGTDVWLGNAQELIRNGKCKLKDVIGCRDDIMVYLIHAGLEEGLSFKIMESVRKGKGLTEEFEQAMKENDVPNWYIDSCKKIKYMFPKAHACAYVLMALRIAWFKVHQPLIYYCAYYSVRASDFDIITVVKGEQSLKEKIKEIKEKDKNEVTTKDKDALVSYEIANEMLQRGFTFSKVDLEKSLSHDYIIEDNKLIPPFSIVPGLGDNVANKIVQARKEKPFLSIEDLSKRGSVSTTIIEYLREMGTLKGLPERAQLSFFDEL
ncbi:DNA polymerase III, alpha subunit [Gemella bergeri ATCC 700627]|uniref:DNA polymerase III PolC-type n=1 Tax=Gemella bergeri ATCC 700627 TaxID=1321820 RepID=U2S0Z9_9BACL|nr:PolC-type DNA polymerase III [Gemella bergeri]ERK56477.1 DNA polymerase III, alpha subunit [Gemella bergeri ATCC 700627]